jgi:HipA-like protein
MTERLSVIYRSQIVATLQRRDDGTLQLTYSDFAREVAEGRVLLSASLPVRGEPYNGAELLPFFEGLLPEELVRQRLAARLRIDAGDVFGFLREIGRECAGALPQAMAWIAEKGARHRLIEAIEGLVAGRLLILRQINRLPPAVALPARAQRRGGGAPRRG